MAEQPVCSALQAAIACFERCFCLDRQSQQSPFATGMVLLPCMTQISADNLFYTQGLARNLCMSTHPNWLGFRLQTYGAFAALCGWRVTR